jgi:hypothetical protein
MPSTKSAQAWLAFDQLVAAEGPNPWATTRLRLVGRTTRYQKLSPRTPPWPRTARGVAREQHALRTRPCSLTTIAPSHGHQMSIRGDCQRRLTRVRPPWVVPPPPPLLAGERTILSKATYGPCRARRPHRPVTSTSSSPSRVRTTCVPGSCSWIVVSILDVAASPVLVACSTLGIHPRTIGCGGSSSTSSSGAG